jgi:hypothetical protein
VAVAGRLLRSRSLLEEKQYSWAVSISHYGGVSRPAQNELKEDPGIRAHHLGLSQQTGECADLDRLVKRNHSTPAAAPHHHRAAVLANGLKAQALQRANDLPSGKVRELRHGLEP